MSFCQITVQICWLVLSSIMFGCWSQLTRLLHLTIPKWMVKWKISTDYLAVCSSSISSANQLASGMNISTKSYLPPGFVPTPWLTIVPFTSCMVSTHVYCLTLTCLMTSMPLRRIGNLACSILVMLSYWPIKLFLNRPLPISKSIMRLSGSQVLRKVNGSLFRTKDHRNSRADGLDYIMS